MSRALHHDNPMITDNYTCKLATMHKPWSYSLQLKVHSCCFLYYDWFISMNIAIIKFIRNSYVKNGLCTKGVQKTFTSYYLQHVLVILEWDGLLSSCD